MALIFDVVCRYVTSDNVWFISDGTASALFFSVAHLFQCSLTELMKDITVNVLIVQRFSENYVFLQKLVINMNRKKFLNEL